MESTNKVFEQRSNKILSVGIKQSAGKLKVGLIPSQIIEGLASVYTWGCTGKQPPYPPRNWEKGISYTELYNACQRHLLAFWRREENDKESGLSHLWHAMWHCGALAFYQLFPAKYLKFDDRPSHFTEVWADEPTGGGFTKPIGDGSPADPEDMYTEHTCWGGYSDGDGIECTRKTRQRDTRRY